MRKRGEEEGILWLVKVVGCSNEKRKRIQGSKEWYGNSSLGSM